jgi:hypothetical protein
MIALDEVQRDVDRQLEYINAELARDPGESTYAFLQRIRLNAIPELKASLFGKELSTNLLQESFVERLAFLHEWARYRTQPVSFVKSLRYPCDFRCSAKNS